MPSLEMYEGNPDTPDNDNNSGGKELIQTTAVKVVEEEAAPMVHVPIKTRP